MNESSNGILFSTSINILNTDYFNDSEEHKDQESIQSSTTPDPRHHMIK